MLRLLLKYPLRFSMSFNSFWFAKYNPRKVFINLLLVICETKSARKNRKICHPQILNPLKVIRKKGLLLSKMP